MPRPTEGANTRRADLAIASVNLPRGRHARRRIETETAVLPNRTPPTIGSRIGDRFVLHPVVPVLFRSSRCGRPLIGDWSARPARRRKMLPSGFLIRRDDRIGLVTRRDAGEDRFQVIEKIQQRNAPVRSPNLAV